MPLPFFLALQKESKTMKKNKPLRKIIISVFAVIGCFQLFTFSKKIIDDNFSNSLFYVGKSHLIPSEVNFCGEELPLDSKDIRERLDKEIIKNTYWHSSILLFYKRTGKYFPTIEAILKKNNIPDDFKYLAIAESGLENVVSPAGARGFWQFMEKTGKEYNLEINSEIDERYHLEKATQATCDYLKDAYRKFGSWTLVAASYNMGMYGLEKSLKRQNVKSYYDLLLNSETARYVFRIVALKLILENPSIYGYNLNSTEKYSKQEFTSISIDSGISDFSRFSISQNINYKILKIANPWLRQKYLKNKNRKTYTLKILNSEYKVFTNYDTISTRIFKPKLINAFDSSVVNKKSDSLLKENILNTDIIKKEDNIETPIK